MYVGAGILMFIFYFLALTKWLGILGSFLSFILAPGIVLFPFVFWIVEDMFPSFYFILWAIGMVGVVIAAVSHKDE